MAHYLSLLAPLLTIPTSDQKAEMMAWAIAEAHYANADQLMRLNPDG